MQLSEIDIDMVFMIDNDGCPKCGNSDYVNIGRGVRFCCKCGFEKHYYLDDTQDDILDV